jgi:hypothetical protein
MGSRALGHWRKHDGDEVDLVVERDDARILALEVKAEGRLPCEDFEALPSSERRPSTLSSPEWSATPVRGRSTSKNDLMFLPVDRLWTP